MIYHNDNDVEARISGHAMSGHATCCGDTMQLMRIVLETNGSEVHVVQCSSCGRVVSKSVFPFADDFEA